MTYLKITEVCQTVDGEDCVFPFIYKEKTYNECTKEGSSNSKPWCATSVMENKTVIPSNWGDCKDICIDSKESGEGSEEKGG